MPIRGLLAKDLKLLRTWAIFAFIALSLLFAFVVSVKDKIPELFKRSGAELPENLREILAS
jgi:hypothetical protein